MKNLNKELEIHLPKLKMRDHQLLSLAGKICKYFCSVMYMIRMFLHILHGEVKNLNYQKSA